MAEDRSKPPTATGRPRLGVVVRLAIYVPLLGFFGWRAYQRFSLERDASDEVFRERVAIWLAQPPTTIMLPNGEALPMLTPEQAEAQGYDLPTSITDPPVEPTPPVDGTVAPIDGTVAPIDGTIAPADGTIAPPVDGAVGPVGPAPAGPTPPGPTPPGPTPTPPGPTPPGPTPPSPTPSGPVPAGPSPTPASPSEPLPPPP